MLTDAGDFLLRFVGDFGHAAVPLFSIDVFRRDRPASGVAKKWKSTQEKGRREHRIYVKNIKVPACA